MRRTFPRTKRRGTVAAEAAPVPFARGAHVSDLAERIDLDLELFPAEAPLTDKTVTCAGSGSGVALGRRATVPVVVNATSFPLPFPVVLPLRSLSL